MSDKPKIDESFVDYANQLVKKYLNDDDKKIQKSTNANVSQIIDTNFSAFEPTPLVKAILKTLDRQDEEVERLAFEVDPTQNAQYKSIWEPKTNLIPDVWLKRISVTDDLVATIVLTRENQISRFGRPRPDRLSTGYVIEPRPETVESIKKEKNHKIRYQKKEKLRKRIAEVTKLLYTCGPTEGWSKRDQLTFTQYIKESVRSVLTVGRLATEICHKPGLNGDSKFAGFRVIDAGTIYRAVPGNKSAPELRKQAIFQLQQLKNKRIDYKRFAADEYKWIQVVKDKPVNAFTDEECIVHDFYSVPDIEANGYPLTPIDTMIAAVATHINITTSNKLYFENGRSSKGFIVLKSDNVSESQLARIKQAFNSSINNVRNSHRTPLFGVGADDSITWTPTDTSSRDMEFQYLSDMNARIILSAFQISPDELPGYTYLSRSSGQQSLSESNNEFKLTAARDAGLIPLMAQFEDFINQQILPHLDPVIAKLCVFKMVGLNSNTAEKEALRLQEDMALHLTFDEIMSKVEKNPVGKRFGGEVPLNPNYQQVLDKYLTVGEILEKFLGVKNASKNPSLCYMRDQYWFQWQQLRLQKNQLDKNSQMQEQQLQQQAQQEQMQQQQTEAPVENSGDKEFHNVIDEGLQSLNKAEAHKVHHRKRLEYQKNNIIHKALRAWEKDIQELNDSIIKELKKI